MRRNRAIVLVLCVVMTVLAVKSVFAQTGSIRYTRWAGGAEARLFATLVQEFMRTHPNIQVKPEFLPWAAYWEKIRTTVMSGDAADVISLSNIEMGPYITRGAFMDLDNMSGATALYAQMLPGEQAADRVNGKIKAMPIGTGVRALVYNKALLDKAGIPYPDVDRPMTWDQFFEMSRKLTIREGDRYMQYTARFHILEMYESLVVQYGGQLMDSPTRPTKMMINSPAPQSKTRAKAT